MSAEVAKKLEEQKLVNNWWSIYLLGRYKKDEKTGEDFTVYPGEYMISAALTPKELLRVFIDRKVVYHDITVPEGFNLSEIAQLMIATSLITGEEVDEAIHDKGLIARFGIPANSMEGYLFPDTYRFTRPDDAYIMIERMYEELNKRLTEDLKVRARELNFSMHQILTLASVIEKETGAAEERELISSVFHNRLRIAMPLQSDPTVIYGIPSFNGNLTKEHLGTSGPYNTYLNTGLPPTPICSPGIEAIRAALNPADTDYLYFVARGDGTHQFSNSYRQHVRAVNKFQRKNLPVPPTKKAKKSSKTKKSKKPPPPKLIPRKKKKLPVVSHIEFE